VNLSVKKFENPSTFGEVMDNIVVPCFLTHSVYIISPIIKTIRLSVTEVDVAGWAWSTLDTRYGVSQPGADAER